MPDCCSPCSTSPPASLKPTRSACLRVVPFSQAVLTTETAAAPDRVRRKFIRPAALSISCGSTLASASPVVGMKKNGRPSPMNISGRAMSQ